MIFILQGAINIMDELTEKDKKILTEEAARIQPDVIREKTLEGLSDRDAKVFDRFNEFYKECCGQDLSFQLFFTLPDSEQVKDFYRVCELDEGERFNRVCGKMLWNMYSFLCYAGFIKFLEKREYIKILPNGEHQSWEEKNLGKKD